MEEGAGPGLGLTAALLCGVVAGGVRGGGRKGSAVGVTWILWGGLAAMLVYLAKMGSECTARLLAAYYPLLIAAWLVWKPLSPGWLRSRFWKVLSLLVFLSALPALLLTPARPLLPVSAMTRRAGLKGGALERVAKVYETYGRRADCLGEIRSYLPEGVHEVGFYQTGDDIEIALWKPYGSRRVLAWESGERPVWLVASSKAVGERLGQNIDEWLLSNGYRPVQRCLIVSKVQEGPQEWVVAEKIP